MTTPKLDYWICPDCGAGRGFFPGDHERSKAYHKGWCPGGPPTDRMIDRAREDYFFPCERDFTRTITPSKGRL